MLKHIQERRQDDKGFTLIELMVVVLIMGILMAIAIPTFLSTRGSANDASAKSDATNAFTNEKSYYASNQLFLAANATDVGNTLDDTLPWGDPTAKNGVVSAAILSCTTAPVCDVVVTASSQSGDCFYISDQEAQASATIGYYAYKPATGNCASIAANELPAPGGAGVVNSASSGVKSTAPAAGMNWYTSW